MSGIILKIIAYTAMLADHIGYVFFPENPIFRIIGRIAMPIFAFFISEGVRYTKSKPGYLIRLLITAAISEIPFRLCFEGQIGTSFFPHNVIVTLLLGAGSLMLTQVLIDRKVKKIFWLMPCLASCIIAILTETDWSYFGILMIFVFYFFKDNRKMLFIWISVILFAACLNSFLDVLITEGYSSPFNFLIHLFGVVALIPIEYYNGKYTKSRLRYLMYLLYPLHLIVIYLINKII